MQEALESALFELVLGPLFDPDDPASTQAFFARHGVSPADADALRAGGFKRLLVYRELVRGTLRDALELSIPRSIARLGPSFERYFERFVGERGARSHYLRDVTSEFLNFCRELWAGDAEVPPYVWDLARHEALHIEIAGAAREPSRRTAPSLDLDARLHFISAARLLRYEFAVHRLPESLDDRSVPERRRTDLFVYRSPEHDVRYLELTPLAAAMLEPLLAGETLRSAVLGAAALHGATVDAPLLESTARLLANLAERGALLGADAADTGVTEDHSEAVVSET